MRFEDEPVPGYPLPILAGHTSPGRFERVLRTGVFAVTTELAPPDSADPEEVFRRARVFDGYVDAINATDGSGANCHMSSVAVCALLTRMGYAPIMQISCRDRNRIAIQGEILGAAAMGVANLLCLTGDGVQAGDHPQAKPVFDLDSRTLTETARRIRDEGRLPHGAKVGGAAPFFLGAADTPLDPPPGWQPTGLAAKVAAGTQFVQTQFCMDAGIVRRYLARLAEHGLVPRLAILIGVVPLKSARSARWMRKHLPGTIIPDAIIARLEGAADSAVEGRRVCVELMQELAEIPGVAGAHVMAPANPEAIPEVLAEAASMRRTS